MSEQAKARKLNFIDMLVLPDPPIHKPEPIKIDYSKVKVIERVSK
jgi:hypothetical protein